MCITPPAAIPDPPLQIVVVSKAHCHSWLTTEGQAKGRQWGGEMGWGVRGTRKCLGGRWNGEGRVDSSATCVCQNPDPSFLPSLVLSQQNGWKRSKETYWGIRGGLQDCFPPPIPPGCSTYFNGVAASAEWRFS